MESQEIFDTVVSHLRTQKQQAYGIISTSGRGQCFYRLEKDSALLKCAIGCLIKDEEYSPKMEGHSVTKLVGSPKTYGVSDELMDRLLMPHRALLQRLQTVHDSDIRLWEGSLENVAIKFNLNFIPASPPEPCLHELEAAHKTDSNYKCKHCGKDGGH